MSRDPENRTPDDGLPCRLARSVARILLRASGCEPVAEVMADLREEQDLRLRCGRSPWSVAAWTLGQAVVVCLYDLRDRLWAGRRAGGGSLHPGVALRLAVRGLRARPGVPLAAASTLAVGFGAAAAILGVYTGFDRPLPVPRGERVVRIDVLDPVSGHTGLVDGELDAWWAGQESLVGLGAFRTGSMVVTDSEGLPVPLVGAAVSPEVFELLDVAPIVGGLPARDDRPGRAGRGLAGAPADAVVLSHDAWQRLFAGDPDVVGRAVRVDGAPMTVAAVMPEGIRFPYQQRVWVPLGRDAVRGGEGVEVVGRLAEGVSPERAAVELQGILRSVRRDRGVPTTARVRVRGFTEDRGEGGEKTALLALLILVVALLLVSCSNVSNLLLGRAIVRSRAMALHSALGATPGQVALQMLAEAGAVALGGAALGLGFGRLATGYIEGTLSGHWGYHWMRVGVGPDVMVFTLGLAVVVALVSGMLPALRSRRADLAGSLEGEAHTAVGGGTRRVGALLVTCQVMLSSAALVVAALMVAGLLGSRAVAEGFPADRVQVAAVGLHGEGWDEVSRRRDFREGLLGSLAGRGLAARAALASGVPGLNAAYGALEIEGLSPRDDPSPPRVAAFAVTGAFFEVMDIGLRRGRTFHAADGPDGERVAVVSEDFVARHLAGEDPLGRRIRVEGMTGDEWARIVGVVADVLVYESLRDRPRDWVYLPMGQVEPRTVYTLIRTAVSGTGADGPGAAADGPGVAAGLRSAVASLDPDLAVRGVLGSDGPAPLSEGLFYVRRIFETTGTLALLGGLAALAVAVIGLYGVLAFEVGRRRAEIGVRMALGAGRGRMVLDVVRRGLWRLLPGLLAGLALAWLAGPFFGVFLMGADPRSPRVFGLVALGYLAVALAATLPPARRAAATDPARVLGKG